MRREIKVAIRIEATPQQVWSVLSALELYSQWNPFITSAQGALVVGDKLEIVITPVNKSPTSFRPRVEEVVVEKRIVWKGVTILKGLFDGEHHLEIEDNHDGTITFTQKEVFTGALVPFFQNTIDVNTLQGFYLMNEALKKLAENS